MKKRFITQGIPGLRLGYRGAKTKLTGEEEEKRNIRERIMVLLWLNDGKTQSKIAEFLGCSVNKVSYWCLKGDPDNLESLIDEMKG